MKKKTKGERAYELYLQGMSGKQACAQIGCDPSTLSSYVARLRKAKQKERQEVKEVEQTGVKAPTKSQLDTHLDKMRANITSWEQFKKNPTVYHKSIIMQLENDNKYTFKYTHDIEFNEDEAPRTKLKLYEDLRLHLLNRRRLKDEIQFISINWKALMHLISFQIIMEGDTNETEDTGEVGRN